MALPEFVSGVILIAVFFAVQLDWFPIVSVIPIGESIWQNLNIVILPALSITFVMFGYISRMQRSSMISVMNSDYIRGYPEGYAS